MYMYMYVFIRAVPLFRHLHQSILWPNPQDPGV